MRLQLYESIKIRSSHPRTSGNVENRIDILRQSSPMVGRVLERMARTINDLIRLLNGHACLELECSLIETESMVNARPLTYVAEGSYDRSPLPQIFHVLRFSRMYSAIASSEPHHSRCKQRVPFGN